MNLAEQKLYPLGKEVHYLIDHCNTLTEDYYFARKKGFPVLKIEEQRMDAFIKLQKLAKKSNVWSSVWKYLVKI